MPINNLEYIYDHLPSRFRREDEDKELFLKRFLQFFGETLNDWDEIFDNFADNINPDTAEEVWLKFWLENLFGWSWFPTWFSLADKQKLYSNFARHLARRGTAAGIEAFCADFYLKVRVHNQSLYYGEATFGENYIAIAEPLLILIEIVSATVNNAPEFSIYSEATAGEDCYGTCEPLFTQQELLSLISYNQPQSQEILLLPLINYDVQKDHDVVVFEELYLTDPDGQILTDLDGERLIDQ